MQAYSSGKRAKKTVCRKGGLDLQVARDLDTDHMVSRGYVFCDRGPIRIMGLPCFNAGCRKLHPRIMTISASGQVASGAIDMEGLIRSGRRMLS